MALQNLLGDLGLDQTLQLIAIYLDQIAQAQARAYPDTTGSMRVAIAAGTLPAVTTVTTLSTLANTAAIGGYNAQYDQYANLQACAASLRTQITVS